MEKLLLNSEAQDNMYIFSFYVVQHTTGFYMAKLDEIGYQVCFSSWRDVYETIQNPEF